MSTFAYNLSLGLASDVRVCECRAVCYAAQTTQTYRPRCIHFVFCFPRWFRPQTWLLRLGFQILNWPQLGVRELLAVYTTVYIRRTTSGSCTFFVHACMMNSTKICNRAARESWSSIKPQHLDTATKAGLAHTVPGRFNPNSLFLTKWRNLVWELGGNEDWSLMWGVYRSYL